MLSGDGQQGAVHVREVREEGGEGVELSRGDVAKVHRVEHHQQVLPAELGQGDLGAKDGGGLFDEVDEEKAHPLLLAIQNRVEGEVRSFAARKKRHCWLDTSDQFTGYCLTGFVFGRSL